MEIGHGLSAKSGRAEPSQAEPSRAKSSHLTDSLGVVYFLGRVKLVRWLKVRSSLIELVSAG